MERIYSAFFTSERRRNDVELTAEALARHDQDTRRSERKNVPVSRLIATPPTSLTRPPSPPNGYISPPSPPPPEDLVDAHSRELSALVSKELSVQDDVIAALSAAARTFVLAYGAKAFTAVLLASRKWSSIEYGYADAVRLLLRQDTIRFGAFFGSLVGLFRLTELTTRRLRGGDQDRTNLAVAGGVAGLALLLDSPSRRSTIALYIFVRMLDVLGRQLTAERVLPTWKYSSEGLFALSNAAIMYGFIVDPTLLPKGYYHWILQMGAVTHNGIEHTIRPGWKEGAPDDLPFRRCQPHYHMESCVTHALKEWVGGLGRALQIYLPVHFLPALIFKFKQVQVTPVAMSAKIAYAALCSSAFLTSYQTSVQLVVCTLRNALQKDYVFQAWLGGIISGGSLFFEDPKRRFELMLYCVPRAIDIIWQLLKRRGLVRYVRHSEIVLFCLSMSVIMSRPPEYFKPTYLRIIRFFFGRHII
ncbi:hypothetical protein PINS_up000217 [Pythium insidiosum]|nr:hypothetical protein PINS_up000217 [Pythium insidiosum]